MRARTEAYAIGAVRDDGRNPMAMAEELGANMGCDLVNTGSARELSAILELEV